MIKSIEAVMAIMILLMFIMVLLNNHTYNDYKENITTNKIYETIQLKAQDSGFRNIVLENNTELIYNQLYKFIDTNYSVKLCDYAEESSTCDVFGATIPDKKSLYSINYYFYDSNKTVNIIIWT